MSVKRNIILSALCCGILLCSASCVKVDYRLGYSLVSDETVYTTAVTSIPIDSLYCAKLDSLSGYSLLRMTIGAIRDQDFGVTARTAAFALVPFSDTLNWGDNIEFHRFHIEAKRDTLSFYNESDHHIIQQIHAFELLFPIDSTRRFNTELKRDMFRGRPEVTRNGCMYAGEDSLILDLSEEFAWKYFREGKVEVIDSLSHFLKERPGVFLCTDDPVGNGGRINFFEVAAKISTNAVLTGSYASLDFSADYVRNGKTVRVDTSFLFALGASTISRVETTYMSFNCAEHESDKMSYGEKMRLDGKDMFLVGDRAKVEGGAGIKPLVRSRDIRRLTLKALREAGVEEAIGNLDAAFKQKRIIINRATIVLPYESPADYKMLKFYPSILNPTMRLSKKDSVVYAGLTDSGIGDANQGNIDYDVMSYHPDISHHLQYIMGTDSPDTLTMENVWFMSLATETTTVQSSAATDYSTQLAYLNYYNSILNGSSYGSSYDNYYNYYMMQQMYSSMYSGSTTKSADVLDRDRYYNATLYGPKSPGPVPRLEITYSYLKPQKE